MNVDLTSYATDHRNFCRTFLEEKKHHVPTPKSESIIFSQRERKTETQSFKIIINQGSPEKFLIKEQTEGSPTATVLYKSYPKIYSDFGKLPPILQNNVKRFANKIRRIGYLNNLSPLKKNDLKIINDQAYWDKEKPRTKKKSLKSSRKLSKLLYFLDKIMNNFAKKVNWDKFVLIHPYSKMKLLWESMVSLLIIFLMFYIPLSLAFSLNFIESSQKMVISVIFIFDMIFEMNTLYFNNGLEVHNRRNIIMNYLEGYFMFDFLSLSSLYFQSQFNSDVSSLIKGSVYFLFFMKFFSLMKFSKKITNRFQLSRKWKGVKDLIVLFLLIIFIAHLAACGWYYVGVNSIPDQHSTNWIKDNGLLVESWQIQYMSSFYWSIVTVMTVGYGDITPTNSNERLFCLFVILFGGMIFPYSVNSIGSIIQDIKRDKKRFE